MSTDPIKSLTELHESILKLKGSLQDLQSALRGQAAAISRLKETNRKLRVRRAMRHASKLDWA